MDLSTPHAMKERRTPKLSKKVELLSLEDTTASPPALSSKRTSRRLGARVAASMMQRKLQTPTRSSACNEARGCESPVDCTMLDATNMDTAMRDATPLQPLIHPNPYDSAPPQLRFQRPKFSFSPQTNENLSQSHGSIRLTRHSYSGTR